MSDLDDLWKPQPGRSWYDTLEGEAKAWFDSVLDLTKKRGQMPSKKAVRARFHALFPDLHLPHEDTFRDNIARLTGVS